MAIIFCDSFDNGAPSGSGKYVATGGRQVVASGRTDNCWDTYNSFGNGMARVATGTISTIYVHFAFAKKTTANYGDSILCRIQDGAGTDQCYLQMDNTTQVLSVYRAGGTLLGSSTTAMGTGFKYISLKVTVHNTAGAFDLWIDGISEASGTNVNTRGGTANNQLTHVEIGASSNWDSHYFDDFVLDTTTQTKFFEVKNVLPTGAGNTTQFTPLSGTNWESVDESGAHDSDTSYVYSNASGQKDTYQMANPTLTAGTIKAVVTTIVGKVDSGSISVYPVTRSGSTDYDGSSTALTTSYAAYSRVHETDPNTSAAWTASGVNAVEVGVKVV